MARKTRRPRLTAVGDDSAFAAELVGLVPRDAALLAGIPEYEGLREDLRALSHGRQRRRYRVPLVLRLSSRTAEVLLGDGAKLYALSDPWAFLNMLRVTARRALR